MVALLTRVVFNLRVAIRTARVEQQDRRAALDALVSRADDDPPGSESATLQEALDQRRIAVASEREALLAEARRKARAEFVRRRRLRSGKR